MSSLNVLLTSAGRRVSLLRSFRASLAALGIDGKIVTADMQASAPAAFEADRHELVPRANDASYVSVLLDICQRHDIRLVVPLIDPELYVVAKAKRRFDEAGIALLVSSPETVAISSSKDRTKEFFDRIGVATPQLFDRESVDEHPEARYPLLVKPRDGSSSEGVTRVRGPEELAFFASYVRNPLVQEFIEGEEYTLDVYVDREGAVRCVVPRLRIETRAGEVSKGVTVRHPEIMAAGAHVVESLPGAFGPITVQCFLTKEGRIVFIEINPRFGGGYPLSYAAGAHFPTWIIEEVLGRPPSIVSDIWQDGMVMLRYDDEIFTTLDRIR